MPLPLELQAARLRLVKDHPYLAAALWALCPVEKPGLGTMAVDRRWRVYFDPAVTSRWSVEEAAGVLYHEICHLLRDHASRMENLDPRLANIAADLEINDDLLREEVKLPGSPLLPAAFGLPEGLLAEEYYEALCSPPPLPAPDGGQCDPRDAGAPGAAGATEESSAGGPDAGNRDGEESGGARPSPAPGHGRCGSCATGAPEWWEDAPPAEGGPDGIGKAEAELIRQAVARAIQEASRSRGDVPAHWKRWAEERLRPKVDWRRELASAVRRAVADVAGAADYFYRRPSRRQGQVGDGRVVLPALRRPVPRVAVVVDTSGSVSDKMLSQALGEVAGVLKAVGQREGVHVLAVDAAVHACRRVFRPEQVALAGGGGTDMGAGIRAAERLRPRPEVVVVLTDGLTPWPDSPPRGMKLVVGLLGEGEAPEWAKTIRISE